MMAALKAGGLSVLDDGIRLADLHNPRGYFEDQRVKSLEQDSSFLYECRGRAVKIIYRLLSHLPSDLECKVLFMERDLDEVLASQAKMLNLAHSDPQLKDIFQAQLAQTQLWLNRQPQILWRSVKHREILQNPDRVLSSVVDFLDLPLDRQAMGAVVDSSLYRHKSTAPAP